MHDQSPMHSASVAAAIVDDRGRFLVIRRTDTGTWEPPGGVLEISESIQAGLVREVAEETGLRVEPIALTGVCKNMRREVIALVFRCQITGGHQRRTEEAVEAACLTAEELDKRLTDAFRVRLLDATSGAAPAVRAHDGIDLLPGSQISTDLQHPQEGDLCEVVITAPDADWLAALCRELVEARLASAANVIHPVTSFYRWEGAVYETIEARAFLRSRMELVAVIAAHVANRHPYEVPHITASPIIGGSAPYLDWIRTETQSDPGPEPQTSRTHQER